MAHEDDLYIAQKAVELHLLSRDQLLQALFEMYTQEREAGERWPLGVILVSGGYLHETVMLALLAGRVKPGRSQLTNSQSEDLDFGRLLVATGVLEPEAVNQALALQQSLWKPGHPSKRLDEILIEQGGATAAQIQRALAYKRTAVLECQGCHRRFHATTATPRATLRCPRCGGTLVRSKTLAFDESIRLLEAQPHRTPVRAPAPPPTRPAAEQAQIDRVLALYLRQHNLVKTQTLVDTQRIQLELSRFGIEIPLLETLNRLNALSPRHSEELARMDFASIIHEPGWQNQTIPGYHIIRRIATGGSSTLFAAESLFGSQTVVIRILHLDRVRDPAAVARFKRESDCFVRFDHPAIVKGIETGIVPPPRPGAPELHFLTLEFVDAHTLDHIIARQDALSPRQAARIAAQIAHALLYLERQGLRHNDVQPENILFDREGFARLCDLGLASEIGKEQPLPLDRGTAVYMSPEVARGATAVGPTHDIYALGLTLYALVTGRPPFSGETVDDILKLRFSGEQTVIPPLDTIALPSLRTLLKQMLEPDPSLRIKAYPDLLEALKQV